MPYKQPNPLIFDTDNRNIGRMEFKPDNATGRHNASLSITHQSLRNSDVKAVFYQAIEHSYRPGNSREPINCIAFIDCNHIQATNDPANFFRDLGVNKPTLAVREVIFRGNSASTLLLFRQFLSLIKDNSFDIAEQFYASNPQCRKALTTLDLAGLDLDKTTLYELYWLPFENMALACLKLQNCGLTDNDVPDLIKIIEKASLCQMLLEGNNISPENLELILQQLHKSSLARMGKGKGDKQDKLAHDFDLPPVTVSAAYAANQFVTLPVHGAPLDLSEVDAGERNNNPDTNQLFKPFQLMLAACNPTEIIFRDPKTPSHNIRHLFSQDGLFYSGSVRKIDLSHSSPQLGDTISLDRVGWMVHEAFANTRTLILDNNNFRSFSKPGETYYGGDLCKLVSAPNLETLSMCNCGLQDKDIFYTPPHLSQPHHLTALKAGKNLRTLDLSGNALSDECVPRLVRWIGKSDITLVRLEDTQLSAKSLAAVSRATQTNSMRLNSGTIPASGVCGAARGSSLSTFRQQMRANKITLTSGGIPLKK